MVNGSMNFRAKMIIFRALRVCRLFFGYCYFSHSVFTSSLKLNLGPRASVYIQESKSFENSWKRTENTTTKVKPEKLVNYHFWRKIRSLIYLCLHFSLLSTIRKHSIQNNREIVEAVKNSSNELNMNFALKFITQIAFIYIQESTRKFVKIVKEGTAEKTRQMWILL